MAESERVGFEAFFETKEFESGIKKFLAGLGEAESGMGDLVDAFNAGGDAFAEFTSEAASFDKKIGSLVGSIAGALGGMALGVPAVGASLGQMLGEMVGGFKILLNMLGPVGWTIKALIPAFKLVGKAASGLFSLVGTVGKAAFTVLGSVAKIALGGILVLVGSLAATVGGALVGAFLLLRRTAINALNAIKEQLRELLDSAITLQKIEVGLGAITRASLVMEGQFDNAADAMQAAIPITGQLLQMLTEISLTSPFSVEDVNTLFRTVAAFGIALGTAIDLTEAMIELGAATGFSNAILERIARNFAQVARNGKIFERDIYELANAGVDLHAVLDTQLNVSVEEMNEQLASGEKTVLDLTDALIDFAHQYYGGSAEALSKTIQGLQTRFKTLGTVMVNDFARPLMNFVGPALETVFDGMAIVVQTGVFEKIGQMVANMGRTIVGNVNWTAESVAETILEFILWLLQTTNKMVQFGYDMMAEWGFGMLKGAADAIAAVARFISAAMSKLFKTSSPPAILPLIDVWGAQTIEAWLEGMTQADFSILDELINTVASIFQNLEFDEGSIQAIMQRIVQAVSTGGIEELLNILGDYAGPFQGQMEDIIAVYQELAKENDILAKIMGRLSSAQDDLNEQQSIYNEQMDVLEEKTKAVTRAQEALRDAMDFYDETDASVQNLVRQYNELLRSGADDTALQTKLDEINAMIDQREYAAQLIGQREDEVDVAEDARDAQKEIVEEQKDVVERYQDIVDVLKDEVDAQEDVIRALETTIEYEQRILDIMLQLTKPIKDATDATGGLEDAAKDLEHVWGGLGDLAFEEFDFSPAIDGLLAEIDTTIADIEANFAKLWGSIMTELGFEKVAIGFDWETRTVEYKWIKTGEGIFDNVGEAFSEMAQTAINIKWGDLDWSTFKANLIGALNGVLGGEGDDWNSLKQTLKDKLREELDKTGIELSEEYTAGEAFYEIGKAMAEGILSGIWGWIQEKTEPIITTITNFLIGKFLGSFGIEDNESNITKYRIGTAVGAGILGGLLEKILGDSDATIADVAANIINGLLSIFGIESPESTRSKTEVGEPIGEGILAGMWQAIKDQIVETATNAWKDLVDGFATLLGFGSPSTVAATDIGTPIGEGILEGLFTGVTDGIATTVSEIWTDISTEFDGLVTKAEDLGRSIIQGILLGIEDIGAWTGSGIIGKIIAALKGTSKSESPSRLFADEIGVPFAQGIMVGMTDEMKDIKGDIFTAVNDLVNFQPTPTNIYTPSTISTHNITNNINTGGNVVRDDMDIALLVAANRRAIKQASYGV